MQRNVPIHRKWRKDRSRPDARLPLPGSFGGGFVRWGLFSTGFLWLLILTLGLWPPAGWAARDRARALEQNRLRLQQVVSRLQAEQTAREQAKGQEKTLTGELEQLDQQLAEGEQRRKEMAGHANQLTEQLPELNRQIDILKSELERSRRLLDQQLRMAYGIGEQGMLKMLFSPRDTGQWREGIQYFGYLIQARNRRFLEYRDTVTRLNSAIKGHRELLERLAAITAKQEEARQQLLQRREERATLLQRVQKDARLRERQVTELARSQERLENFVTRLETLLQEEKEKAAREKEARAARKKAAQLANEEAALAAKEAKAAREKEARAMKEKSAKDDRQQESSATAKNSESAEDSAESSIGEDEDASQAPHGPGEANRKQVEKGVPHSGAKKVAFGQIGEHRGHLPHPVPGRGRRKPPGMFFQASPATPVRAVFRGEVVYADWFRGYGLMIILGHGHRAYSLYGHNQRLLVNQGDWVNEGDKIAETGDTGSLEGVPGLYFEIRHQGKVENPTQWLASGG
ncbi:MAG: peptidoglycan DD-metalloendopeptidase family protein [Magnetococcales bacterium]|nr:peptidoglycan DD-metalloendopeptidase family protein [Magnetococcales bacterium]